MKMGVEINETINNMCSVYIATLSENPWLILFHIKDNHAWHCAQDTLLYIAHSRCMI